MHTLEDSEKERDRTEYESRSHSAAISSAISERSWLRMGGRGRVLTREEEFLLRMMGTYRDTSSNFSEFMCHRHHRHHERERRPLVPETKPVVLADAAELS